MILLMHVHSIQAGVYKMRKHSPLEMSMPLTLDDITKSSSSLDELSASDYTFPTSDRRRNSDDLLVSNAARNSYRDFVTSNMSNESSHQLSLVQSGVNPGLSRQQLLSGPCPVCGDRISGFHYGIFSCESCKGFFKRTVQNKKNYVCLRGANCPVTIASRKKCPACRFDKCLKMGMKLEAIREDRTRGGRSTYQCSYTLSPLVMSPNLSGPYEQGFSGNGNNGQEGMIIQSNCPLNFKVKHEPRVFDGRSSSEGEEHFGQSGLKVPSLIKEILSVEHLLQKDRNEKSHHSEKSLELMDANDFEASVCNIADHRLYKLVKWCKSLPLFKEITMNDQIALLINSWCELLLLSCCYRSLSTPGQIRISSERCVSIEEAKTLGINNVIERMINLTEHLRRLHLDQCEYVCLKVIILLTSDAGGLQDVEKVHVCQKQILEALQTYTAMNYPGNESKFGEILLRIPELVRVCQVANDSLASKQREKDIRSFKILMELLRGDH